MAERDRTAGDALRAPGTAVNAARPSPRRPFAVLAVILLVSAIPRLATLQRVTMPSGEVVYRHFEGDERVFRELRVPPVSGGSWQEQVRAFAAAYRDLVLAHPNLILALIANADLLTEGVLLANETLYAALDSGGLSPLEDQELGGLVMWVPAGLVYVAAGLALAGRWVLGSGTGRAEPAG